MGHPALVRLRFDRHAACLLVGLLVAVLLMPSGALTPRVAAAVDCVANPIPCENQQPGTPESTWDVSGAGSSSIQGFATDLSINQGGTISFKINTTSANYTITIYRIGWYQGNGARQVASVTPSARLPQQQPACLTDSATGLIDCGNWAVSATWAVPATAVSGVYVALLKDVATAAASHIEFVVRNDSSTSDILFRTNDTTWQAYNDYGGNSLYVGSAPSSNGRAYKVSYNRPFNTRQNSAANYFYYAEYPMVRWLEANGYNVSYVTGVDAVRSPSLLKNHKTVLTAGHDEYWSNEARTAFENARDAGVNLALLTGNDVFWKVRWESSIDGSSTANRTMVCYKETLVGKVIDPQDPPTWTGSWRDPRFSPPADGGRPENALLGPIFMVNRGSAAITVTSAFSKLRFWRNTAIAGLGAGQQIALATNTIGYEWDEDLDNGFRPKGLFDLSSTTVSVPELLQDYGGTYGPGTATHSLTMYRAASGALVFGAGTIQWSWGLDPDHDVNPDTGSSTADLNMQQATVNLLADMGAQPGTIQSGLVAASPSTDKAPPQSIVSTPASGSSFTSGNTVTVTGTASDVGGVVAGVAVTVDGGNTWHPAAGTTSWSYSFTAGAPGTFNVQSRAVDDSGNIETPSGGVSITIAPRTCPCTLFTSSQTPSVASVNDPSAVELGVKFTSDSAGYVNGVKFYKGSANTGTHTGTLWTTTGTVVATGTFTNETASGWQTLLFATPVAIQANTVYIASYHTTTGNYATTTGGFTSQLDVWPLHAPAGNNGVYVYGGGNVLPTQSFNATNYWVDVIVNTKFVDTVNPAVTTVNPVPGSTGASFSNPNILANFNKNVAQSTIQFTVKDPSLNQVAGTVGYNSTTYTATFTPSAALAQSTQYTATINASDTSGNPMQSPYSWTFTTNSCPCTLWPSTATPANASVADPSAVELGVKFQVDVGGYINGVKFYKGTSNTGPHTGNLWSSGGQLLATASFTSETASGWQQVLFPTPVQVSTGQTYVASYFTKSGNYAANSNYFANQYDNSPLHAPSSGSSGGNGVYAYGSKSQFPNQSYNATNYWVDALFSTTFSDTVPPTVTSETPAPGATGVHWPTTVTATFSKSVKSSTISFTLTGNAGASVASTVSYNDTTHTATLTPSSNLAAGVTYTATVSGATDQSGNVMTAPFTWSFTTQACPCTIWPSSATPATASVNDPSAIELGLKFRTDVAGLVTGVRFYKGSANTGTHVGNLWTNGGQLLASATFTSETASGWQQVTFSSPVAVSANTTYVVSYHTNTGNYADSGSYFNGAGVDAWPLHALASGVDGPNGLYAYGASQFPTQSYQASNYWVDVVYSPS